MGELIDLWWWWLTGVEKGVKNYSRGLGRNPKELAVKTLTFCHIDEIYAHRAFRRGLPSTNRLLAPTTSGLSPVITEQVGRKHVIFFRLMALLYLYLLFELHGRIKWSVVLVVDWGWKRSQKLQSRARQKSQRTLCKDPNLLPYRFLGHMINWLQVQMALTKLEAISKWPTLRK